MYDALAQLLAGGGAAPQQAAGPQTLGAMPNPGAPAGAPPQTPMPGQQQPGGMDAILQRLQSPGMLGLLGAGTSMIGAAGQPGGLGQALTAGAQGGLGGMMMGQQAQKEDERNAQLQKILEAQGGVMQSPGAVGGMPQRPPGQAPQQPQPQPQQPSGLYGAY